MITHVFIEGSFPISMRPTCFLLLDANLNEFRKTVEGNFHNIALLEIHFVYFAIINKIDFLIFTFSVFLCFSAL